MTGVIVVGTCEQRPRKRKGDACGDLEKVLDSCVLQKVGWRLLLTVKMVEVAWGLEGSFPLGRC